MEEKTFSFCPFCGAELEESNLFCTACGNEVKREISATVAEKARGMKWYYFMIVGFAFGGLTNIGTLFMRDWNGFVLLYGVLGVFCFYVLWHLLKKTKACPNLVLYLRIASFGLLILDTVISYYANRDIMTVLSSVAVSASIGYFFIINEQKWFKNRIDIFKN